MYCFVLITESVAAITGVDTREYLKTFMFQLIWLQKLQQRKHSLFPVKNAKHKAKCQWVLSLLFRVLYPHVKSINLHNIIEFNLALNFQEIITCCCMALFNQHSSFKLQNIVKLSSTKLLRTP